MSTNAGANVPWCNVKIVPKSLAIKMQCALFWADIEWRLAMIRKAAIASALVAIFTMPAVAATEYWVAKDAATKKCEVVSKKPDGRKLTDAGNKTYTSKANAEKALKELAACK